MSEEIQLTEDHGDDREESGLEEITFMDPASSDLDNSIIQAVVPPGMEWMQQVLGTIRADIQTQSAQSAFLNRSIQNQFDLLATRLIEDLPVLVKREVSAQTRFEPVGDSDALERVESELRSFARRIESVESSEHQPSAVILAEIRDSQNVQSGQIQVLIESVRHVSEESHTNYNTMGHLLQRVRRLEKTNARPPAAPDEVIFTMDPRVEKLAKMVERQG